MVFDPNEARSTRPQHVNGLVQMSQEAMPQSPHAGLERRDATLNTYDNAFRVTLDGDHDPFSPRSMPILRKWSMVLIICAAVMCVTCTSSIYATTYTQLKYDFDATRLTCALGLSTFVLGIAFGPLLTGPLSEHFGRRPIYLISWSMFVIWTIPSAVAQNMTTLIITRFFNGFSGSTFLSVAGGTVGDIFPHDQLQKPMGLVSLASFIGPSIGPVLGGVINSYLHWRWTYYIILIWSSMILLAVTFVPETYHPVISSAKARTLRIETGDNRYWAPAETTNKLHPKTIALTLMRPLRLCFLEPMCLCLNIYSAILLGILYLFFGTIPQIFRTNYGMNLWQSGLAFLGIIIGMLGAAATNPIWIHIRLSLLGKHQKEQKESKGSEPEYQLPPAIVGGILIPIGLFWFAWTLQGTIHWVVPIAGTMLFGCGVILVFNGIFTYLVEAYSQYAASALAGNSFLRAFISVAFPLIQIPMYDELSYQWGTSVLAFLTVAMMPFPWLFFKYGNALRRKSMFATST